MRRVELARGEVRGVEEVARGGCESDVDECEEAGESEEGEVEDECPVEREPENVCFVCYTNMFRLRYDVPDEHRQVCMGRGYRMPAIKVGMKKTKGSVKTRRTRISRLRTIWVVEVGCAWLNWVGMRDAL